MRPEKNPLDLNNLPEDYSSRDHGKLVFEEGSSSGGGGGGCRKKKSGGNNKEGKDECGKVYECRFCSLKFCKSQALGGHMNRHRQERETETLNRARQLVFSNDNLAAHAHGAPHLGCHPITPGSYHPSPHLGDSFRSMYPPKLFSPSSSALIQPPPQLPPPPPQPQPPLSYPYPSTSRYPPNPINDYYVGHVLTTSSSHFPHHHHYMGSSSTSTNPESNYTCIGAPVGQGIGPGSSPGGSDMAGSPSGGGGRDGSLGNNQDEGLTNNNWGRSYRSGGANHPHHRLDPF